MDDTMTYDTVGEYFEQKYTSTTAKLLQQQDRFDEWRNGIYRPISLQLAPTDKCNLRCNFCSVDNRDGDQISFEEAARALDELTRMGLRTVEFTGGGDPTMYPFITDLIELSYGLGLGIGFITNGVAVVEKIDQYYLDMLDWMRISMNCLDYVEDIDMPVFRKHEKLTTLGFSYVINLMTTKDIITRIIGKMDKYGIEYLRVVPNCLSIETINESKAIALDMGLLEHPRVFWQQKKYDVPNSCFIGYLKPFLNSDGFFYYCSANPLIDRKFNHNFRMGRVNEIDLIWNGDYESFYTGNCQTGKCFFREHNELLDLFAMQISHKDFI